MSEEHSLAERVAAVEAWQRDHTALCGWRWDLYKWLVVVMLSVNALFLPIGAVWFNGISGSLSDVVGQQKVIAQILVQHDKEIAEVRSRILK